MARIPRRHASRSTSPFRYLRNSTSILGDQHTLSAEILENER
jgi:hypothetical protein